MKLNPKLKTINDDNNSIFKMASLNIFASKKTKKINHQQTNACGDHFNIFIKKTQPFVQDITFDHSGCILSKAATNSVLMAIENKERGVALTMVQNFIEMIESRRQIVPLPESLMVFKKFAKYPSRINCIVAGPIIILKILQECDR